MTFKSDAQRRAAFARIKNQFGLIELNPEREIIQRMWRESKRKDLPILYRVLMQNELNEAKEKELDSFIKEMISKHSQNIPAAPIIPTISEASQLTIKSWLPMKRGEK